MNLSRLPATLLVCSAFFCSGVAALAFEALWFHQTGLSFGHGVMASALVLSGFMAGMATGNLLAARFGDRWARPLRAYALLELTVAVSGVALVFLIPRLAAAIAPLSVALEDRPLALGALRLGGAWLVLLVPSAAMGMTLPLSVRGLTRWDPRFGRALGLLYGINTLGAVLGALLVETSWLPWLGVHGSAWLPAGLGLLAASLGLLVDRAQPPPAAADAAQAGTGDSVGESDPRRAGGGWLLLLAAALGGFAMLGLEVLWLRFLLLYLVETPLAFATVLALVLLGIGAGGWLAGALLSRFPLAFRFADALAYAAGASGIIGLLVYPRLLAATFVLEPGVADMMAQAAPIVLAPALLSGMLLTFIGAALRARQPGDARVTGRVVFANTLGGALGSALAGLVLLPTLGMETGLVALLGALGVTGLLLTLALRPTGASRAQTGLRALTAAGCLGLVLTFPFGELERRFVHGSVSRWMGPEDEVVEVREDATATLIHVRHRQHGLFLFDQLATNAYSMAVNDFAARRYMRLYGYLPLSLHPGMKSALIVGFGVGNTASALTAREEFEHIDVVDISRGTLDLSRNMRFLSGKHPLDDPRVSVHIEDGRHHLLGTSRRYDLITGEPPPPILAGVSNLYSAEYFELLHSRLNEGGFVSYWLPMMNLSAATGRSIIAAFCEAFSDCTLWHGTARNFMLLGSRGGERRKGPVSFERYLELWRDRQERQHLVSAGFEHPTHFATLFIGDARYLRALTRNDPPVSDVFPRRMHRQSTAAQTDKFLWQLRDTEAAARRFRDSAWVKAHFPPRVLDDAPRGFEQQRLLNDLLFPGRSGARSSGVLMQVLKQTPFILPPLLLMHSDPDIQREIEGIWAEATQRRDLYTHVAAAHLARRQWPQALSYLSALPSAQQPLPGLAAMLQQDMRRQLERQGKLPQQPGPRPPATVAP